MKKREQSSRAPTRIHNLDSITRIDMGSQEKDGCDRFGLQQMRKKYRETKSLSRCQPLQSLVGWAIRLGGLTFTAFRGADFAHGGVAGALAGAPNKPTGDGAVRAPAFTKGEEFIG